ncbi:MAG TPA: Rieske (2Fe-2S) protein, partial [Burkholderiaceae bacterium]
MVEPGTDAQALCASTKLLERGQAVVFDVMLWRAPARAFALRFDGRVVAYMNRCAHVPSEMDWQVGQ